MQVQKLPRHIKLNQCVRDISCSVHLDHLHHVCALPGGKWDCFLIHFCFIADFLLEEFTSLRATVSIFFVISQLGNFLILVLPSRLSETDSSSTVIGSTIKTQFWYWWLNDCLQQRNAIYRLYIECDLPFRFAALPTDLQAAASTSQTTD